MPKRPRTKKSIAAQVAAMDRATLEEFAVELAYENGRLRTIAEAVAKADLGTGALVEIDARAKDRLTVNVLACRPDGDEEALCRSVLAEVKQFFSRWGEMEDRKSHRDGVGRLDEERQLEMDVR